MKRIRLTTALGIFAISLGLFWLFGCFLMPLYRLFFNEEKEFSDYAFFFVIFPLMAIPGVMAAKFGFRLLQEKSKKNIKGTVGAVAIFGVIFCGTWVSSFFGGPKGSAAQLSLLIGSLCAIPCYVFVSKKLILGEGLVFSSGEFVGRRLIGLLTMQVWLAFSTLIEEFAPIEQGYDYVKETPWNFVGFLGPFLCAWIFYKLAMSFVVDSRTAQPISSAAN